MLNLEFFTSLFIFSPRYSLFNVGGTAALDVQVADNTFGPQDFEVVGGQLKVTIGMFFTKKILVCIGFHTKFNFIIDRIAPGSNATHVVVIRPSKFGYFNFTAAEVTYLPSENAAEVLLIRIYPVETEITYFYF